MKTSKTSQPWSLGYNTKLESVGGGGSTVNSEAIDDQQSTVRGSTVNSEAIDDQQSTVRGSMVNSEAIDDQQSTVRGLMVNSEAIDNQQFYSQGGSSRDLCAPESFRVEHGLATSYY